MNYESSKGSFTLVDDALFHIKEDKENIGDTAVSQCILTKAFLDVFEGGERSVQE